MHARMVVMLYHPRPDPPPAPDLQRSPTVAPSSDNSCPNPPSQCHIVCLLYNGTFTPTDLINTGEWRGQFQVVIAGKSRAPSPKTKRARREGLLMRIEVSNVFNKIGP